MVMELPGVVVVRGGEELSLLPALPPLAHLPKTCHGDYTLFPHYFAG